HGHDVDADGTTWRTLWQVTAPTSEPLSVLAHLYAQKDDLIPVAGADGLGYSTAQWQPGDQFVQVHRFDSAQPFLLTGLYDYTTGERLPLRTQDGTSDTAVWLYNDPVSDGP
ncbi:MAG: hypothetical protein KDD89_04105, partial [Anaerolineales bacterium]|nr:hypothetical protein [Anaerolineales bacterium]